MEEFVNGYVQTFDGIVDSRGRCCSSPANITPPVHHGHREHQGDSVYYLVKELPEKIARPDLPRKAPSALRAAKSIWNSSS